MHKIPDTLGDVIKEARQNKSITIESMAEKLDVTERYMYRLENEHKKPSYDILFRLIRELSIDPELIFYPEKSTKQNDMDSLIRMLYQCDERALRIIKATIKAALESQHDE